MKSKVIHVQIPVPKREKMKKWEKIFWVTKQDNKGITNQGSFRDFKLGKKRLEIRTEISNQGKEISD